MSRNEEFSKLLEDVENLNYDNHQNIARAITRNKRHQFIKNTSLSLLTTFTLFTVLVNTVPGVAYAASQIPIIKELAEAVKFSRSLETAVENNYVQVINSSQTQNGVTITVEYMIVDTQRAYVFYTSEGTYPHFRVSPSLGSSQSGVMSHQRQFDEGALNMAIIDKGEVGLASPLQLNFSIYNMLIEPGSSHDLSNPNTSSTLEGTPNLDEEVMSFTFNLEFDPTLIGPEVITQVNEAVVINNQKLWIESVEVYPTRMVVHVREDEANTKILSALTLSVEDENQETYEMQGSMQAIKQDNRITSYELETNYFNPSELVKLTIEDTKWYEKSEDKIKLNLKDREQNKFPEGIEVMDIQTTSNEKVITLKLNEGLGYGSYYEWRNVYYDKDDNIYYPSRLDATTYNEVTEVTFPVTDYPHNEVWLVINKIEIINEEVSIELNK